MKGVAIFQIKSMDSYSVWLAYGTRSLLITLHQSTSDTTARSLNYEHCQQTMDDELPD